MLSVFVTYASTGVMDITKPTCAANKHKVSDVGTQNAKFAKTYHKTDTEIDKRGLHNVGGHGAQRDDVQMMDRMTAAASGSQISVTFSV
jgi:hypothetical protein